MLGHWMTLAQAYLAYIGLSSQLVEASKKLDPSSSLSKQEVETTLEALRRDHRHMQVLICHQIKLDLPDLPDDPGV